MLFLEILSVEVRFLPAAELNIYTDTILYYVSLPNIRQGVKQGKRVQLQAMNNLIKFKFKTLLGRDWIPENRWVKGRNDNRIK